MTGIRDKKLGVKRGKAKSTYLKYGGPKVVPGGRLKTKPALKGTRTAKGKGPR